MYDKSHDMLDNKSYWQCKVSNFLYLNISEKERKQEVANDNENQDCY